MLCVATKWLYGGVSELLCFHIRHLTPSYGCTSGAYQLAPKVSDAAVVGQYCRALMRTTEQTLNWESEMICISQDPHGRSTLTNG